MVKKTYITPAYLAVELNMRNAAMLTASDESTRVMGYGGEGDGLDIGAKESSDVNVWNKEW